MPFELVIWLMKGIFMHNPCLVFTKTGSIMAVNKALDPYSFNVPVEFKDKTEAIQEEFAQHQMKYKHGADSFDEFLNNNYYETAELNGKTCYGYWFNPQTLYDGYVVGGRYKEWLVLKETAKHEIARNQQDKQENEKRFTYWTEVSEIDMERTIEHISSLYDPEHKLYAVVPSYIDEQGKLHMFPEEYIFHPEKLENIDKAKQFQKELLEYMQNNPKLQVTMIDCHN